MISSNLLNTVYTILANANLPLAFLCFIMAGMQLRAEGGVNYGANGGFFRWIVWGCIMLTITPIMSWLSMEGIVAANNLGMVSTSGTQAYASNIVTLLNDFVNNVMRDRIVPVIAGALILKALLDAAEGHSPIPSIVSSIFLLGIVGFYTSVQFWMTSDQYATTELISSILNWAMSSVAPVIGAMCLYGAILQYVRKQNWGTLAFVGIAFLSVNGIWILVKGWVGVTF